MIDSYYWGVIIPRPQIPIVYNPTIKEESMTKEKDFKPISHYSMKGPQDIEVVDTLSFCEKRFGLVPAYYHYLFSLQAYACRPEKGQTLDDMTKIIDYSKRIKDVYSRMTEDERATIELRNLHTEAEAPDTVSLSANPVEAYLKTLPRGIGYTYTVVDTIASVLHKMYMGKEDGAAIPHTNRCIYRKRRLL